MEITNETPRTISTDTEENTYEVNQCHSIAMMSKEERASSSSFESSDSDSDSTSSSWSHSTGCSQIASKLQAIAKSREAAEQSKTLFQHPPNQQRISSSFHTDSSPQPRLLWNHGKRQLEKLMALHDALLKGNPETVRSSSNNDETVLVADLLEEALRTKEHASLKRWVELQQRIYDNKSMPKSQKLALRKAGIRLAARSGKPTPQTNQNVLSSPNPILVVKKDDGTITDKFLLNPKVIPDAIWDKVESMKKESLEPNTTTTTTTTTSNKRKRKHASSQSKTTNGSHHSSSSYQSYPSEAAKRKRSTPPKTNPKVGDTIWVHYQQDDWWFQGKVISTAKYNGQWKQGKVSVDWEDGTTTEEVLAGVSWGVDNDPQANYNANKEQKVASLKLDTKLLVYWPKEGQHYQGTLTEMTRGANKPHFIQYEDGDKEWTNLKHRQFTILEEDED